MVRLIFSFVMAAMCFGSARATEVADKFAPFEAKLETGTGGTVRLNYQYIGEPISRPANLSIYLSCAMSAKEFEVAQLSMCSVERYQYDKPTKFLSVSFTFSRVDAGGRVHCDQKDEKQYSITKICREAGRKKPGAGKK